MRDLRSEILENKQLADGIYKMTLETPKSEFAKPGQFAMVEVPEKFLRRPISVSSYDSDRYTLIYKVVGGGTEILSKMEQGEHVRSITGLGNGYNIDDITDGAYIIGGGIGIPPMLGLLKTMVISGKSCKVILGYNSADEMFMFDDFQQLADDITVMTADGSYGQKGFVTDAFSSCEYACACGPLPMLRALDHKVEHGQFSLEARMGCGFGACMGCSIRTTDGSRRVCKEGPVFDKEVLKWEKL